MLVGLAGTLLIRTFGVIDKRRPTVL